MKNAPAVYLTSALIVSLASAAAPALADNSPAVAPQTTQTQNSVAPPAAQPPALAMAAQPSSPPADTLQPKQAGDITYVTGGVGADERSALEAAQKDYNLHIMAANDSHEFVDGTHIVIRNPKGDIILDATAGPIFYVRLPAGSYTVEASHRDQTKTEKVTVAKDKPSHIYIGW